MLTSDSGEMSDVKWTFAGSCEVCAKPAVNVRQSASVDNALRIIMVFVCKIGIYPIKYLNGNSGF